MKKTFTILIAAIAAILMMAQPMKGWATDPDVTYTFASFTSAATVTLKADNNNLTITLAKNNGSSNPAWVSPEARVYAKGSLKVASASGNISKIVYTYVVNKNKNGVAPTIDGVSGSTNAGTWDVDTKTWEGNDNEVTFSTSGTAGNVGFTKLEITYASSGGSTTYTLSSAVTPTGAGTVVLSETSLEEGETATATATANTHFTFTSWSIAGDGASLSSTTTNPTTVTMGSANATVTATFTEDPKYNITYNANYTGATDEPVVVSDYAGESLTIASYSTFTRAGYAITSWNTAAEGNGTSYSAGDSYTMTSAGLTLYAQWEESNEVVDVLNYDFTGISGSSYQNWSDKVGTSGAVYAGNSNAGVTYIQLRSTSPSGIVSTTSGGKVKKVVVTWNSGTSVGRTLDVYGKNSAYTGSSQLFGSASDQGTKIGSIVCGTSTELTINDDYEFIGMRSNNSAMYLDEIRITWEPDNDPAVTTSITINDENLNNDCGNSNTNGGTLSATVYDNQNTAIEGATVTWESSETSVATIDATTGAVTLSSVGTTTITARYAGIENEYKPAEATYTLNVIDSYAPGGSHNPYSVAEARDFIDGLNGEMSDEVYVTGIISQIDEYISNYKSITYWISDNGTNTDQLEVYSGKGINGANFTSINDLQLKDEVVVKGNLKLHNNSIYEFNYNNQLVSLIRKTITVTPASIEATSVQTVGNLSITTENMTISDLSDFSVQYYDNQGQEINDPGWITFGEFSGNGDSFSVGYTIATTTEARDAYFKVFTYSDEIYSNLIIVSQAAPASTEYYQYSINGTEGDLFQTTTGTEIELPATVNNIPSGFTFAGWTIDADDIEHIIAGGTNYTINTTVEFFAVFAKSTPVTFSYTLEPNDFSSASYGANDGNHDVTATSTSGNVTVSYSSANVMKNNTSGVFSIQWKKDNTTPGEIYNTISYGTILSVEVDETTVGALTTIIGNTSHPTEASSGGFFSIKNNGTATGKASSVTVTFVQPVAEYYTRVFLNETPNANVTIVGPSIIPSGKYLNMGSNALTNTLGADELIIEDGGQLITTSSVAATIQKNITAPTNWANDDKTYYYAISSPIGSLTAVTDVANLTTGSDYDLYKYVEGTGWQNQKAHNDFGGLQNGKGYLYAREEGTTLNFSGITTGESVILSNLTKTGSNILSGMHLIGNPYTHNIYKGVAITGNLVDNYYALNNATGAWEAALDSDPIAPMQGVLVFVTDNNTTVTIANNANAPASKANNDHIRFIVADGQYEDIAYAWFEKGEGLKKINHRNSDIPMVYIPQDGTNYAIAAMDDNTQAFNLNFKAMTTGQYTLKYKTKGEFGYMHIYDRLTGNDVDMLLEGEYTFIGSPSDNDARFIVRLGYMPNYDGADNFVYQNGNDIIVNGEGELQIFDVMGRMVKNTVINGVEAIAMPQGVYIFRLNENIQKIVVR